MLLRTSSTPARGSFDLAEAVEGERARIAGFASPAASSCCSSRELDRALSVRRIQSESDLSAVRSLAPPCISANTGDSGGHGRLRNGSRRSMPPLKRHSSLPAGAGSALDSFLDELKAPVPEESVLLGSDCEEERCSISGCFGGNGGSCLSSSTINHWSSLELPVKSLQDFNELHAMSIAGGFGIGGGGGLGTITGGGGGGGNRDRPCGMDAHYRRLLAEDPGNSLLLRNYARYLYEKRDLPRAEELYERAILASPDDAELRAQYARLIWEFRRDEERAASYFEQAAQASPDDCSVLGAYAAFMWDVDEDEEPKNHAMPVHSAIVSAA
ncbi:uncharacterized protein LOC9651460 [Selaginella moellendorffii]|nr:uncharacterized protein LOC9651460 [Selaginella moellendorffii]|eukprot:XP_002968884.2 uncharacterized protein LOC9651460 [Selaginella moellendorffii]